MEHHISRYQHLSDSVQLLGLGFHDHSFIRMPNLTVKQLLSRNNNLL